MAGGRAGKGGKKASAALAAHAAGKSKSAAVEITADNEARVRDVLAGLQISPQEARGGAAADAEAIADVYERLLNHGFRQEHVQQALQAVAGGEMSEAAALDWLCLHVDPSQLPRRFARAVASRPGAGSGVKVLAKAEKRAPGPPQQQQQQPAAAAPARQPRADSEAERRQREARAQQEQESRRAWIMQYMEQDDSSDASGADEATTEIEDWELFADPREVARRKAERKKAALPPEVRRAQLAAEWAAAKAAAADAKAAADKARQKQAGGLIRDLKLEMQQLGVTEADLEQQLAAERAAAAPQAAADAAAEPDLFALAGEDEAFPPLQTEQQQQASPAQPAEAGSNGAAEPSAAAPAAAAAASGADSDGSDVGLGGAFHFYESAAEQRFEQPGLPRPAPKPAPAPWGAEQPPPAAGKRAKGGKGRQGKGKEAQQPEPAMPRALLQQLCHREGRPAPRYEQLPPGGGRLPEAGIRYAVALDPPAQKGGGKKRRQQRQLFSLREREDGWGSIQEAQNAAATLALRQVATDKSVWHRLPPVYQELWQAWDADRPAAQSDEAERQQFAQWLASQAGSEPPADASAEAASQAQQQAPLAAAAVPAAPAAVRKATGRGAAEAGRQLQQKLRAFRESAAGQRWMGHRQGLPVWGVRDGLLAALEASDVAVVGGDTGCGKTTQVPQFLLDAAIEAGQGGACSVVCTQPRRIAAISVAERVCQEREEAPPGAPGSCVGYHVRLDASVTRDTRLLFCTTGILLRRLASDPLLATTSHVVVDEVHERTLQGDFLLALLKDVVAARRAAGEPLKVVLMSATLDSRLFAGYFGGCPSLAAGGRTFPVEQLFLEDAHALTGYVLDAEGPAALRARADAGRRRQLQKAAAGAQALLKAGWGDDEADLAPANPAYQPELYESYPRQVRRNLARLDENAIDYDLLEALVSHLADSEEEGAILVFLPGMAEISTLLDRLAGQRAAGEGRRWLLPLHSSVSPQEQRRAFETPPPGVRKIVLATNIAETSLTIADASFVVDSGKLKERRYDASRRMSLLVEDWISRASALQRKGRAGRVRAGKCFALFTRDRFEQRMRAFQAPEMVRVPLEELVLQILLLGHGPPQRFLERVIEPPPARSVAAAVSELQAVGALAPDETLTPLGHHLAQLPVDTRVGKLLLLGASLECLAPVLTIAACLSYKSPFLGAFAQQEATQRARLGLAAPGSKNIASGQQSDHLLMAAAFQGWQQALAKGGRRAGAAYAAQHMLSQQTLEMLGDMRAQFATMLADARFVAAPSRLRSGGRGAAWADDPQQAWNKQAHSAALVKAVLCAALYPNVAVMDAGASRGAVPAWNDGRSEAHIHSSSVNAKLEARAFHRPYLVYMEKVTTGRTFLRECSVVSPMTLLLFGGELAVRHEEGLVLVDGWLRVRAAAPTAVLVKQLRLALDTLLQRKIASPELDLSSQSAELVATLVKLLSDEEAQRQWQA